jgi:hypothetical protein
MTFNFIFHITSFSTLNELLMFHVTFQFHLSRLRDEGIIFEVRRNCQSSSAANKELVE